MRPRQILSSIVAATALAACAPAGPGGEAPPEGTLDVAVSLPPLAYLVDRVGGERVTTRVMIPPGTSPHAFEPSPKLLLAVRRARLYVAVGDDDLPLEKRIGNLLGDLPVVEMARWEGTSETDHPAMDPHVWLSPPVAAATAREIATALAEIDPGHAELYRSNLDRLEADIAELDRELQTLLAPLAGHRFLVDHPAWGHFAARYGLEQVAIEEEGKEPSPARLVELVEQARREGVRTVFVQRGLPGRGAGIVAGEIGAAVVVTDPLAYDWPDSLRVMAQALVAGAGSEAGRADER